MCPKYNYATERGKSVMVSSIISRRILRRNLALIPLSLPRSIANFNKLNWIPLYDEVKINKHTLVYKSLHDQAPQYIKNLFKTNNEINGRQTRYGKYN